MECQVLHIIELGLYTQFIGELKDIKIDEDVLGPSGFPDVDRLDLFVLMDGYRTLGHYLGEPFMVGKDF